MVGVVGISAGEVKHALDAQVLIEPGADLGVERAAQLGIAVDVRPELAAVMPHVGGTAGGDRPEQFDEGEFGAPTGAIDVEQWLDPLRSVLAQLRSDLQGLAVANMNLFGWDFGLGLELGPLQASFILNYVLLALLLVALGMLLVKRLERSWVGLNMDAIRLDETASACFGIDLARWKITAFTLGNFLAGVAGAVLGTMLGFIAPANFTFADSLIMVSIALLGGIGNPWGVVVAAAIVIVLPEKLQIIQEYRFLLFASVVILILLFRPQGLLPRELRRYLPGWSPP